MSDQPTQSTQSLIAQIIDEAVACWHEIADSHEFPHCNCFREALARSLIEKGIFVGYDQLERPLS